MRNCIQELSNISLARLWNLVSNPWKIPMIFADIPVLSNNDAALFLFPDLTPAQIEACRMELLKNNRLFPELDKNMIEKRSRRIILESRHEFLYMAIRFARPQIVFETGVFDGQSSSIILQALHDNNSGMLVSVDLPADYTMIGSTHAMKETTLPAGCPPGWVIPGYLKERHRLFFGDSKKLLPELFNDYPKIDIFFHDSMHTFEYQYFEYTTAWAHIKEGGILLSDDILWSSAFYRFCREKKKICLCLKGPSFGAVRK